MDIASLVGTLSSFLSLESYIKEKIGNHRNKTNAFNIESMNNEFKKKYLGDSYDEFKNDKLDEYITKHSNEFYMNQDVTLFTEDQKEKILKDFIERNISLKSYELEIKDIFNSYFECLNKRINSILNDNTKVIINNENKNTLIIKQSIEDATSKISRHSIYEKEEKSSKIISQCNSINGYLLENLNISIWKKDVEFNYLCGKTLIDVNLRIRSFISLLNKSEFDKVLKENCGEELESLFKMIKKLSPDLSIALDNLYFKKIIPTINCIKGIDSKDKIYYIAIGALGLQDDNSDEQLYECIMNNLCEFFSMIKNILHNYWKNNKEKILIENTSNEMHFYFLKNIKHMVNEENIELVKYIYENNDVRDIDLAKEFEYSIVDLRKKLYPLTKKILTYSYNDNSSTKLYIRRYYRKTFEIYYNEIFGGAKYES